MWKVLVDTGGVSNGSANTKVHLEEPRRQLGIKMVTVAMLGEVTPPVSSGTCWTDDDAADKDVTGSSNGGKASTAKREMKKGRGYIVGS